MTRPKNFYINRILATILTHFDVLGQKYIKNGQNFKQNQELLFLKQAEGQARRVEKETQPHD